MAAEREIQEYFEKTGAIVGAAYNAAMRDGSIPALGREAIKDVRNTIHEIFFGRGEGSGEPGAPLNPLFHDIVQARESHEAGPESPISTPPPSPADLGEGMGPAPPQQSNMSPAELVERSGSVHGQPMQQGVSPGLELPADVRADVKAAGADIRDSLQDSPTEVGREELGQPPAQDPARQRIKL